MAEITPDASDPSRCISVHWSLPVQCVLPRAHRENWHETWHPNTGNRIRYRRSFGTYLTEELRDGEWHDLRIPAPGDVCGDPRQGKPDVFCQAPRTHNQTSWTHHAVVDGCTYTWNTIRQDLTPDQVRQDMAGFRRLADEQSAVIERLRAFIERGFDTHMQFGVIKPDGTTEMMPCADWCNACKLAAAEAERDKALAEAAQLRAELADAKGHLAEALRILDDGPQWVNDRVMQHWSVPAVRAANVLRTALAPSAAAPTT